MVPESGARVYAAWDEWLLSPAGIDLGGWLLPRLDAMLEDEFGYFAMQCGMPGLKGLRSNRMSHRIHLTVGPPGEQRGGVEQTGTGGAVDPHSSPGPHRAPAEPSASGAPGTSSAHDAPSASGTPSAHDAPSASGTPKAPEAPTRKDSPAALAPTPQLSLPLADVDPPQAAASQALGPNGTAEGAEQVPAVEWIAADAYDSLPVASSSIDLLVLPFVLEFSADPHAVLREAHRVLRNEGRLVIAGLNPWSLWGLQEFALSPVLGSSLPVEPRMIALGRLRDWLRLLEFDIDRGRFGCYKPLCTTQVWLDRWSWIEEAGDRWWPICGAAYLIGAVKRVQGMRLVGVAARSERKAFARPQVAGARSDWREAHGP